MARKNTDEEHNKHNHVLQYIDEAVEARKSLMHMIVSTTNAYKGYPGVSTYKRTLDDYATTIKDISRRNEFKKSCAGMPERKNDTVFNAVETFVSMAMGGPDQFKFGPHDKYQEYDDSLVDRLTSAAEYFYDINQVDSLMPQIATNLCLQGAAYLHLKPCKDIGDTGKVDITLLEADQMLNDPLRFKRNRARFTGYTQMESWSAIKDLIKEDKDGKYSIDVINSEVDVYIDKMRGLINGDSPDTLDAMYKDHLDTFYGHLYSKYGGNKKNSEMYQGDDVEISYVYDIANKYEYWVLNRKYIVKAKKDGMSATIQMKYLDSKGKEQKKDRKVYIDSPIIEIPFLKVSWETYPVSPLFYALDDFDSICAMESIYYHNLSIMAPITFIGSSFDADIISRAAQVPGELIEGTNNQTGVFSKAHDMTPIITAMDRYENRIKRMMGAVDQYELQSMIGNRATASEVSSVNGAVSQRLNRVLASIEVGMNELTRKFFNLFVIYSDKEQDLVINHNGISDDVPQASLAGDMIISSKLKSVIKLQRAEQSRNALQVLGFISQSEAVDKRYAYGTLIPIVMQGLVTRKQAEQMLNDEHTIDRQRLEKIVEQAKEEAVAQEKAREEQEKVREVMDIYAQDPEVKRMMAERGVPVPNPNRPISPEDVSPDQLQQLESMVMGQAMADPASEQYQVGAQDPYADPYASGYGADINLDRAAPGTLPEDAGAIINQPGVNMEQ